MIAAVSLGSNRGDRRAAIKSAIAAVTECADTRQHPCEVAEIIETQPWGYTSTMPYLNTLMVFETKYDPVTLLQRLQQIEHSIDPSPHRDSHGNYIDRTIDIDLIAVDDIVIDTPFLTLPHPRMHLREFVLRPMTALLPQWRHPLLKKTPPLLLSDLPCSQQ